MNKDNLFTTRKSLDEICSVPKKIISVYSLEKHVWADSNSPKARKARKPELRTIEEFQIDPVRPFLNDIFRNMAAPYNPERKDNPIGQGYWIQAEFGSGKSHLLSFLAALALGDRAAWQIIRDKEKKVGRGKRESLYRFWKEGLERKSSKEKKGIFVIVKTLVGAGGGTVGLTDKGQRLTEYILDAAKEQIQLELGKNISLYPTELLADRFLSEDLDRYRTDLKKFLRDPRFFEEDEFEDIDDFIRDIQQNRSPEYKRSCGNKLWRFYTEYLKVQPQIAAETEDILKHLIETILAEGYSGVLLVLDEMSLFMINRTEEQKWEDAKTLVVLANRLGKIHNLPVWTVVSAQQAIEARVADRNIIADDRLKLVRLLENPDDYYNIVLTRVRTIEDPTAINNYFLHYKSGFSWPDAVGKTEFERFFPFHKPAIEILNAISYKLTTTRSAIAVMHQVLKHQVKKKGKELIRLWELFDETVQYEEDPSGTYASLSAIKSQFESEYRAYDACIKQIDALTKGYLKVYRDKAIRIIQTLFLYHISRTRQQGITPEEIANSVLMERDAEASVDENIQHYETLAENLKKELRQIVQTFDEDNRPRYRFDPVFTGVDPRDEFQKARDEAEANEVMLFEAWEHLLALDEWPVRTRQMTIDLSSGVQSIFRDIAIWDADTGVRYEDKTIEISWQGRQVFGRVTMRDLGRVANDNLPLPPIDSDQTDLDFAVFIGTKRVESNIIDKLLARRKDPRILFWTPDSLTPEERDRLIDFAAYRKLVSDWQGKETEDAVAVISWVASSLQTDLGKIERIVHNSYTRGRVDALNNTQMDFHVAGELPSILTPLVDRVLSSIYKSKDIKFEPPFLFRKEEGVKVINGIVKTGSIPKGAKPNRNISAAQNFGFGLKIMKKTAERQLDVSDNPYVHDIWSFIDSKLADKGQTMKVETLYKNFMGIGGPRDYGLTRRMVQIFLLCLVKEGKIRIGVGPKSGLSFSMIDYSNIGNIDFSARILDSLTEVQKMAQPENWEVLRPYAEKLLGEEIPATHDDAIISSYRTKLHELFAREKDKSEQTVQRTKELFAALECENPYETVLTQMARLFAADLTGGDDINLLLFALKDAFAFKAFDTNNPSQTEIDDLANRLKNYRDVQRFLEFESDLRAANEYCRHPLPELRDLRRVRSTQRKLAKKLRTLQTYIDSDVKLKTELVGRIPPERGETGTLGVLVQEYTTVYVALHDDVLGYAEKCQKSIEDTLKGDEFKAFRLLEKITALQPPVSETIEKQLRELASEIFSCPSASRASVEQQLKSKPFHECGLTFLNATERKTEAEDAARKAKTIFNDTFNRKIEVFLSPAVRERLEQGKSESRIKEMLACLPAEASGQAGRGVEELRAFLIKSVLEDVSIIDLINRFLKRIVVKRVKLAEFKPSISTVEKAKIPMLAREFEQYLEQAMEKIEDGEEILPMLQIE